MNKMRLIVTAAMISVIVASTVTYVQFGVQANDRPQVPITTCPPDQVCFTPPFFFNPKFTYTVKFLCTLGDPDLASRIGLERGLYKTDINIHNPSFSKSDAPVVKKFILAGPENPRLEPPPATQTVTASPFPYVLRWAILKPDAAMRLDCFEIILLTTQDCIVNLDSGVVLCATSAAKGFVMIYSDTDRLDVWAEYTTLGTTAGLPPSVAVVKIQPVPFTP